MSEPEVKASDLERLEDRIAYLEDRLEDAVSAIGRLRRRVSQLESRQGLVENEGGLNR